MAMNTNPSQPPAQSTIMHLKHYPFDHFLLRTCSNVDRVFHPNDI
jgi:hypothetical protein